jgi:hypothetical protein
MSGVLFDYLMMAGDQPFFTRMVAQKKTNLAKASCLPSSAHPMPSSATAKSIPTNQLYVRSKVKMIAAVGRDFEIGKNNALPWKCPADLTVFKQLTLDHTVIMGANTAKVWVALFPAATTLC